MLKQKNKKIGLKFLSFFFLNERMITQVSTVTLMKIQNLDTKTDKLFENLI